MKIFNNGDIRNGFPVIPQNQRKKILLLSDDLRLFSGIGTMSKEFVTGTCHIFNWVQIGGAMQHPEKGKIIDMTQAVKEDTGVQDPLIKVYPVDGYGDQMLLRRIMEIEKPDAILHFTDPRFWVWLYQMEHEIRTKIPIFYLNIWDDVPFVHYNENFYRSCDLLMSISKQTYAINKYVLGENDVIELHKTTDFKYTENSDGLNKNVISYVPHGINSDKFYKITPEHPEYNSLILKKQELFGHEEAKDFVLFYNSRNIRRKMTSDVILAYKTFCDKLTKEQAKKCVLLLHTQPIDENGTDLPTVINAVCPEYDVKFSDKHTPQSELNILYNIADVTINLASNEGFGLGTAESLMTETPIIVNVTGGLQDQCGFMKEDGTFLTVDDLSAQWATNHDRKYKKCGVWAKPVFPATRSLLGSVPTPYIFDDRCDWEDAAERIFEWYNTSKETRELYGKQGRAFCCLPEIGMSAAEMCRRMMNDMKICIENYKPRKQFTLHKVIEKQKNKVTGITLKNKE